MQTITLKDIHYSGRVGAGRGNDVYEILAGFTCEFEFGKSYLLNGILGRGAWALSWIIGGALHPQIGEIYPDHAHTAISEIRKNSWLVRYDEIKLFGIFYQSVATQIRDGINASKSSITLTENELKERFALTEGRYNRPMRQLSSEAWRASCAVGFANDKTIFCFPHMRPDFVKEYRDLWLHDMLNFLKQSGALVIFPTVASQHTKGLSDAVIDVYRVIGSKPVSTHCRPTGRGRPGVLQVCCLGKDNPGVVAQVPGFSTLGSVESCRIEHKAHKQRIVR